MLTTVANSKLDVILPKNVHFKGKITQSGNLFQRIKVHIVFLSSSAGPQFVKRFSAVLQTQTRMVIYKAFGI